MKTYIGLTLLLLVTSFSAIAQSIVTASNYATNPPDFIHLSYEEANAAVKSEDDSINAMKAIKISPEYITNLIYQLQYGHLNNDNKTLAIYFLGTLRPTDADSIEFLIEDIDFRASRTDPLLAPLRWGQFPAQDALRKIGLPTVDPILNHLPKEDNELRRQLMCNVLKQVLRHE